MSGPIPQPRRDLALPHSPTDSLSRSGFVLLWAVRIGIAVVLLIPLIVRLDFVFPWVVGKSLFARSIIEVTFAFWAALVLFHRPYRPSRSWVLGAFAVWLLVSCLAAVFGVSPARSIWSTYERMLGVFDLFHWFAFAVMARSVLRSAGDWRLFLGVNLVSGSAVCAISLVHHYGLIDVPFVAGHPENRIQSTLGNPLYLGPYVTLNALIGAALFFQVLARPAGRVVRGIGRRAAGSLCAFTVLVHLWTMWLSGTRTALAGLGAAFLVFAAPVMWSALRRGGRDARRMAAAIVVLIVSAVGVIQVARTTTILDPVIQSSVMLRRIEVVGQNTSVRWRFDFVKVGLRASLDRPVLGWGPENFMMAWGHHNHADTGTSDQAHNKPVEELTAKGLLGFLSYLALWAAVMSAVFRSLRGPEGRGQVSLRFIGAALVACFVMNLFQVETPASMMQFSLLAALAAFIEASRRSRESIQGADTVTGSQVFGWLSRSRRSRESVQDADSSGLPAWGRSASLRASLDRFAGLSTGPMRAGLALAVALAMLSLVHLNLRTASAASAASRAITPSGLWSDRLDDFTRSIGAVPGLGLSVREYFLEAGALGLADMSEQEFQRAVDLVALEVERGLMAEPYNWLLAARAVIFYQLAATRDRENVEVARLYVDRVVDLAPRLPLVASLVSTQKVIEAGGSLVPSSPD